MSDKRSAVEAVSLRESLTRSRTRLRWIFLDVNVSDGLTKFDHRTVNFGSAIFATTSVEDCF